MYATGELGAIAPESVAAAVSGRPRAFRSFLEFQNMGYNMPQMPMYTIQYKKFK
jgi:hypothetical protein